MGNGAGEGCSKARGLRTSATQRTFAALGTFASTNATYHVGERGWSHPRSRFRVPPSSGSTPTSRGQMPGRGWNCWTSRSDLCPAFPMTTANGPVCVPWCRDQGEITSQIPNAPQGPSLL